MKMRWEGIRRPGRRWGGRELKEVAASVFVIYRFLAWAVFMQASPHGSCDSACAFPNFYPGLLELRPRIIAQHGTTNSLLRCLV